MIKKVHLAQIKLAPSYFPILSGSGPSRFRAQIQQPETLSDLINFVSFGHIFRQDLDLAILLHQDVHLAQTELYQMGLLTVSPVPPTRLVSHLATACVGFARNE